MNNAYVREGQWDHNVNTFSPCGLSENELFLVGKTCALDTRNIVQAVKRSFDCAHALLYIKIKDACAA